MVVPDLIGELLTINTKVTNSVRVILNLNYSKICKLDNSSFILDLELGNCSQPPLNCCLVQNLQVCLPELQ